MFTSQQKIWSTKVDFYNQLHATDFFLYPQKTSENLWFSDVFRGYRKRAVTWNGLVFFLVRLGNNDTSFLQENIFWFFAFLDIVISSAVKPDQNVSYQTNFTTRAVREVVILYCKHLPVQI